ncbi:hypothetical protein GGI43DRAFT_167485 [Trichoderma evansii]
MRCCKRTTNETSRRRLASMGRRDCMRVTDVVSATLLLFCLYLCCSVLLIDGLERCLIVARFRSFQAFTPCDVFYGAPNHDAANALQASASRCLFAPPAPPRTPPGARVQSNASGWWVGDGAPEAPGKHYTLLTSPLAPQALFKFNLFFFFPCRGHASSSCTRVDSIASLLHRELQRPSALRVCVRVIF